MSLSMEIRSAQFYYQMGPHSKIYPQESFNKFRRNRNGRPGNTEYVAYRRWCRSKTSNAAVEILAVEAACESATALMIDRPRASSGSSIRMSHSVCNRLG